MSYERWQQCDSALIIPFMVNTFDINTVSLPYIIRVETVPIPILISAFDYSEQ